MASMNEEIKTSEIETEVMDHIASSSGKLEEQVTETMKTCDRKKEVEVEHRINSRVELLMDTLRVKWVGIKRLTEEQIFGSGFGRKSERIRAYQVWPGKNVSFFGHDFVMY